MPGMQDAYSINVSNRYELSIFGENDEDTDSTAEMDPIEALKLIEEQQKRDVEAKKKAAKTAALKSKNVKKNTQFKEIKDSNRNVSAKNEENNSKDLKNRDNNNKNQKRGQNDRQPYQGGDENRRPPRRRNENRRVQNRDNDRFGENVGPGVGAGEQVSNRFNRGDGQQGDKRPERFRGGRGGYRGGFRGNRFGGGYRNDGRDDRGKREFDRRSGSDRSSVKPSDKRDGGGSHNWGTPEIEEATENTQVLDDSTYDVDNGLEKSDSETKNVEIKEGEEKSELTEEPKEPEPVEMTLDEWKALQTSTTKVNQDFKVRRPGEGENVDQWKGMKVIHKSREDEKSETTKETTKQQTKATIPVNFRFGDAGPRPSGRGGRGRGGPRRGPRQFANRDNYRNQAPPDVENEREFPTLG